MKIDSFNDLLKADFIDRQYAKITIILLLLLCLTLTFIAVSKTERIVIYPQSMVNESWIESDKGSVSMHEAWALMFANLMGNTNYQNIEFTKKTLAGYLAPKIHSQIISSIAQKAAEFKEDKVVTRFEPVSVTYEPATGKTFVYGTSSVSGVGDSIDDKNKTYELILKFENYRPVIKWIDAYPDKPHDLEWIAKQEEKAKK
jgi:conjugal transfer pilus assembly protein TraE